MAINIDYTGQLAKGALDQMNKTREQSFQQQGIDTQNRYADISEKTFDFNKAQKEKEAFQGQFKSALDQAVSILNSTTDPVRRQAVMQTIQQLGQVYTGPVAQQYGLAETNARMIDFALQNPTVQEQGAAAGTLKGTEQQANYQTLADAGQPVPNAQQGAGIYVAPRTTGAGGGGGGTGMERMIADYMAANPEASYSQALAAVKTGFDKNTYIDETGTLQTFASQKAIDTVDKTIKQVDNLLADKDLSAVTGLRNPMKGALPMGINVGYAKDVKDKIDQLRGAAFLDAYERLKGGGPISNVEGDRATIATARLNEAQTDDQFIESVKEWRDAMSDWKEVQEGKKFSSGAAPTDGGDIDAQIDALERELGLK